MKKTVLILFGGKSPEHEVSVKTAYNVLKALDKSLFAYILVGISRAGCFYDINENQLEALAKNHKAVDGTHNFQTVHFEQKKEKLTINNKTADIGFPLIHGICGEDGNSPAFFNMFNLPFVGNDVKSSAIAMDKDLTKRILKSEKIPVIPWLTFYKNEKIDYSLIIKEFGFPMFIKAAEQGSSIGVFKVSKEEELEGIIKKAFQYGPKIIIEKAVIGREIEVSVLGNKNDINVSMPGEIIVNPKYEFYSYDSKYMDSLGAKTVINPEIDFDLVQKIKNYAEKTFKSLECSGLMRVDFFLLENGDIYVNEVNTMPGFTEISMYPKLWINEGLTYQNLITKLILLGFEYFNEKQSYLLV